MTHTVVCVGLLKETSMHVELRKDNFASPALLVRCMGPLFFIKMIPDAGGNLRHGVYNVVCKFIVPTHASSLLGSLLICSKSNDM